MKITVEFGSTQEMREFCQQFGGVQTPIKIEMADTSAPEQEKKKTKKETALPVQPATFPPSPAQAAAPTSTPTTPIQAAAPATALTHDTIARAAAKLIRANPATKDPIKAALARYKVDMIPNLPADVLPAFAQELRSLGGEL